MNTQSHSGRGDSLSRYSRSPVGLVVLVAAIGFCSGCAEMKQYSVDSWQGPLPMQDLRYVDVDPFTPVPRSDPHRASTEGPIVVPAVTPVVVPAVAPVVPAENPVVPVEPAIVPPVTPTVPVENPIVAPSSQTDPEPTNRVTP